MYPIFDLHIHAVPQIDDGSRNMEESLEILKKVADFGVTDVFCTCHSDYFNKGGRNYKEKFEKLSEAVRLAEIPVKLHKGCEVRCVFRNMESIINRVDDGWFDTLGDSKYVLLELCTEVSITEALQIVKMFVGRGYVPIVAHMERNYNLAISSVGLLVNEGALVQVNAYSFVDKRDSEMREKARILLKNSLVHFVGSDAHRVDERLPNFSAGIQYVMENSNNDTAYKILYGNAKNILCI